jgi:DNA-directed RNA polymerase subunit RPC12/RpoP
MDEIVGAPDESGATVISIEVIRRRRYKAPDECVHRSVLVNEELAELECRSCHAKLNPISWVMKIHDTWAEIRRLYSTHHAELERLNQKRRVRCPHCNTFHDLRGRSEDEKRRQAERETVMFEALDRIRHLSAARPGLAAEVAREALDKVMVMHPEIPGALAVVEEQHGEEPTR